MCGELIDSGANCAPLTLTGDKAGSPTTFIREGSAAFRLGYSGILRR